MIFLNVQLDDFPVFPPADRFEDASEFAFDLFVSEHLPAVLRCPDQVVLQVVETV